MSIAKCNPILWKTDIKILTKAIGVALCRSISSACRKIKNTLCQFPLKENRDHQKRTANLQKFLANIDKVGNSSSEIK